MHAFDVLGDPVRRRILELLADGELSAGAVTDVIRAEFLITQPAVSQQLKVLRENGFALVRAEGTRRLYSVDTGPLQETDAWLDRFRHFWAPHLDALTTELARGQRERRLAAERVVAADRVVTPERVVATERVVTNERVAITERADAAKQAAMDPAASAPATPERR